MSRRDVRELGVACLCHAVARLVLRFRGLPALLRFSGVRLPVSRSPLSEGRLTRIAHKSREICGGSCLTESVVLKVLAARHGHAGRRLTIGVRLERGRLNAHAWAAPDTESSGYVPFWTESGPVSRG